VIVSYFEWVQGLQNFFWNESEVTDRLFRILEQAFSAVVRRAKEEKISTALPRWRSVWSGCWRQSRCAVFFPKEELEQEKRSCFISGRAAGSVT
jgi:hypothetical protein